MMRAAAATVRGPSRLFTIRRARLLATSSAAGSASTNAAAALDASQAHVHLAEAAEAELDKNNNATTRPWRRPLRDPVLPYPVSPRKAIPKGLVPLPTYALSGRVVPSLFSDRVLIHDQDSIRRMRRAARVARQALEVACSLAQQPDITTDAIDTVVHDYLIHEHGAYPSPLNYAGFPKSLCASVNEVICHGIPNSRPLQYGDVVSFDVSCYLDGVHGDNCATVIVGDDEENGGGDKTQSPKEKEELFVGARRLVQATRESLDAAIAVCRPGGCLSHVGEAIHSVADAYGYDTVRKYRGHGIGHEFHRAPFVKHYRNKDHLELRPGMIFTIEPMLTQGSAECSEWDDHWTVVTCDGGLAAQFEHTVLITDTDGVEVLTVLEEEKEKQ